MGFDIGIDHNIKKRWLPYSINADCTQPNLFTFRRMSDASSAGNDDQDEDLRLRICPSQDIIERMLNGSSKNCDVAHRLLFPPGKDKGSMKLNFNEILRNIPAIQIREFIQDSRINEIQNLFTMFTEGMKFYNENKDKKPKDKGCIVQKLRNALQQAVEGAMSSLNEYAGRYIDFYISPAGTGFEYASVMSIPYILYTKLIASTTQNYYVLPYNGKIIFNTDGSYGYGEGMGGLKGVSTSSESIIGKALNFIGAQIRVDTTPRFKPGGDSNTTTISITLDLFNDSLKGAITNFLMINTLFPGNMWMQYHLFNVAPNLYDIKVEGFQRLYMCTGKFSCECKGNLRTPSEEFLENLKMFTNCDDVDTEKTYNNKWGLKWMDYERDILDHRLIKIPDVYSLKLDFTSLLPNNLNGYLWQFSSNANIVNYHPESGTKVDYRDGFGSEKNIMTDFVDEVKGRVENTLRGEGVL